MMGGGGIEILDEGWGGGAEMGCPFHAACCPLRVYRHSHLAPDVDPEKTGKPNSVAGPKY